MESVEKGRRLFHPFHSRATAATTVETGRFDYVVIQSEFRTLFFKVTSALKPEFTLKIEEFLKNVIMSWTFRRDASSND